MEDTTRWATIPKGSTRGVCHRCQTILDNPKGSTCFACKREIKRENNAKFNVGRDADKRRVENKKYRTDNGKNREYNLKSKYGLTYDPITDESQCEICSSKKNLVIDHDHATKKYRGILCHPCNIFLGKLELRLNELPKFMEYLLKD